MSKRVMVIDDSPAVRKLIEVTLAKEGYEVVSVPDGVEALRALLAPGAPLPDLIVLDLVMPRMDGFGFALTIKERPQFKAIPFVVLSRRVGLLDRLLARLAGIRADLSKPLKPNDLLPQVVAFIGPAHDEPGETQPGSFTIGS
jgi:twitching motility two-component system response regulator PilG